MHFYTLIFLLLSFQIMPIFHLLQQSKQVLQPFQFLYALSLASLIESKFSFLIYVKEGWYFLTFLCPAGRQRREPERVDRVFSHHLQQTRQICFKDVSNIWYYFNGFTDQVQSIKSLRFRSSSIIYLRRKKHFHMAM